MANAVISEHARPLRVAIVDDDTSVRRAIGNLVESLGYKAEVFESGRALIAEDLSRFGCVVSDLQMPGMSGLELQTTLRTLAPMLPFIVITAFPEERLRQRALAAGARGFLEKPFDVAVFVNLMSEIMGPPDDAT